MFTFTKVELGVNNLRKRKKWPIYLFSLILAVILIYAGYSFVSSNNDQPLRPTPSANEQSHDNGELTSPTATGTNQPATEQPNASTTPQQTNTPEQEFTQHINQQIQKLSILQKIGQLLIIGIEDDNAKVSKQTAQLITEQAVGNIILFKRNINSNAQVSSLIQNLKNLPQKGSIPLWISIDQEGGKVNRLPQKFPSAQHWAELDDTEATKLAGQQMGEALSELSIDIDFAPVLDINNNADNPVIGSRAFGSDAESVVKHSMAMLDGLNDYVVTVGKHFPGHGDTNVDSHYSLPVIQKSWDDLERLELIPFREAIKQGVDAIMVGHLYLPQIDEQYPASLSSIIIKQYLREELGFEGVVISDDLVMGGITEHYDIGEAAVLALQAGNTMLIVGHEPKQQQAVIQALVEAVEQGTLEEELIDRNVARILRLKLGKASLGEE